MGTVRNSANRPTSYEQPWHNDQGQWQELVPIGTGAYGTVMRGVERGPGGRVVAIKKVRIPIDEDGVPQSVLREVSILRRLESLNHSNVIKLLDVCHGLHPDGREMYLNLIFEYCESDLAMFMSNRGVAGPALPHQLVRKFSYQLLSAVEFLHANSVIHRDIKPQNVLVTGDENLKLTDYGLGRIYSYAASFTALVVTLWYRAPDVLLESSYASAVDIWSVGCIMVEMYLGYALLPGTTEMQQLHLILELCGTPPSNDWPVAAIMPLDSFPRYPGKNLQEVLPMCDVNALGLISWFLQFNPDHRPSASAALRHAYFLTGQPPTV